MAFAEAVSQRTEVDALSSSPQLTADMVFKGRDEADEVRQDIFFLTVAAEGFRFGPTTPAKPAGATLLNKNTFVFLSHISTLLTTGSQSDFTAASVNAVTGQLEPDGHLSIICTRNETAARSSSTSPKIMKIATDPGAARRLLDDWFDAANA